jgi:hypothetical protein
LTPKQVIQQAHVPGTQTVLVLGCYEQRVTVYSQQVRALNLVDAMISEKLVREGGTIAIVGGGVAGITAAVALAKAAPRQKRLELFEGRSQILEFQRNSTRYLHPHLYDWPSPDSLIEDAGLPIMNWRAGEAGDVAAALRVQFEENTRIILNESTPVTGLDASGRWEVRVITPGSAVGKMYDVVVLAIGFGLERYQTGDTPPYWHPSHLAGALLTQSDKPNTFISGNGDGGLVEFQMAAFNALDHQQTCKLVTSLDLGAAKTEVEKIEQEAWEPNTDLDLLEQYRNRLTDLIPVTTWQTIRDVLRSEMRIHLHTNEKHLLRRDSALHNRVGTFLAIEADRALKRNLITVSTGIGFVDNKIPTTGPISLEGQPPFTPMRRYLRLGPDKSANFKPFEDILSAYPGKTPASAVRPESPVLSLSARNRFQAFAAPTPMAIALPVSASKPHMTLISVTKSNVGFTWSGSNDLDNIAQVWVSNEGLVTYIDVSAADAGPLIAAIARTGAHTAPSTLYTKDVAGWRGSFTALCAQRQWPSSELTISFEVKEWEDPPAPQEHYSIGAANELADALTKQLNLETLRQLHHALHEILGSPQVETSWPIEEHLKSMLWAKWQEWYASLQTDPVCCLRFLLLLATEQDACLNDRLLVRVGPRIIRPYLTMATIFGLAFSVCSGYGVTPASGPPGNVATQGMTGHACGVDWIDGLQLGPSMVSRKVWTTSVVLLSQLREAVQFAEGEMRMDRSPADRSRIGSVSMNELPLIFAADETFLTSLAEGAASVRELLRRAFDRRANAGRAALEEAK